MYKFISDLHFYVTGGEDENELILATVLQGFFDAVSLLLRLHRLSVQYSFFSWCFMYCSRNPLGSPSAVVVSWLIFDVQVIGQVFSVGLDNYRVSLLRWQSSIFRETETHVNVVPQEQCREEKHPGKFGSCSSLSRRDRGWRVNYSLLHFPSNHFILIINSGLKHFSIFYLRILALDKYHLWVCL